MTVGLVYRTWFIAMIFAVLLGCNKPTELKVADFRAFKTIYEPSGVQWIPGFGIVLVEDEKDLLPKKITLDNKFRVKHVSTIPDLPLLSDLEGITATPDGTVYMVTSHADKKNAKRKSDREQLVSFSFTNGKAQSVSVAKINLRDAIISAYPLLNRERNDEKQWFNIEGLAYDVNGGSLLIALRSPVVQSQALIVRLKNPSQFVVENARPVFADELVYLDLAGGGIRSIVFDPQLKGYVVVSRQETSEKQPFKLWLWDGDTGVKNLRVKSLSNLDKLEGVSPVEHEGESRLMLVFDDGSATKQRPGHYAIADYSLIQISD